MGDIQDVMVVENVRKEKYKDIYTLIQTVKKFSVAAVSQLSCHQYRLIILRKLNN